MAAKFFTGLPLDGPDPECVLGHGETAAGRARRRDAAQAVARPLEAGRRGASAPSPIALPVIQRLPDRACDESPLAGLRPGR